MAWCVPQVRGVVGDGAEKHVHRRLAEDVADRSRTRISESIRSGSVEEVRHPSLIHSQRRDEGEHRRKIQQGRYFTKHQTWRYIDILQDLVQSYNNIHHRSIGMAPSQVSAKNQEEVWQRLYCHGGKGVPKFRVSDRVRISKFKRLFKKGDMANWSEEMFTIHKVHPSDPPVYRLIDDLGEVLDDTFYEPELQKVSVPDDKGYRVESVLQRRKVDRRTEALVKWFGYPSIFNNWIDAKAFVHYKD